MKPGLVPEPRRREDWSDQKRRLLFHSVVVISREFLHRYPWQITMATSLLLISNLIEGVGILTLLPILELLIGGQGAESDIARVYQQVFNYLGLPMTLPVALATMVGLVCATNLFLFGANLYRANMQAAISRDFRLDMIRALMRAEWQFFTAEPIGRLTTSILQEADQASNTGKSLMQIASRAINILVYLATALLISLELTLAGLAAGLLVMVLMHVFVDITRRQSIRLTALNRSYTSRIVEFLQGLKPLKAMALEHRVAPFLEQETEQIMATQRKLNLASNGLESLLQPITAILVAAGLLVAVQFFDVATSALLVIVALFTRTIGRVNSLLQDLKAFARLEAPYIAFTSKLKTIAEEAESEADSTDGGKRALPELERGIVFDKVGFTYGEKPVLSDLSLTIATGQVTAIVGPSGVGKSTLLDLLIGLLTPQQGVIEVDGTDLKCLDRRAWRRQIGYVPQDTILFNSTILENLTLGDPAVGEADAIEALKDAGAWHFVSELAQGIHSMAGERGLRMSGGQRQRLAIARALVHRPKLLLLDEATSALDARTEQEFCQTLRRLVPKTTIVAISHRPAIEEIADVSYHLHEGRLKMPDSHVRYDKAVSSLP